MAKLILSMDGLVLKEIPLTKERTTIGRKPHNDIQIDNLAVSGEHAVIVTILNDSFLEDLGSTNGTIVNGNPIKKHFLQNNDVIELGKYKLKFVGEAAPAASGEKADFEKTMVLRPAAMKAAHKNLVTKALGIDPTVEPEIHEYPTKPGDIYLLCSDGLCDMVDDEDISMTLQALGGNLKLAAQQLVQMANDAGGRDNVSVILVRVLREYPGARGVMAKVFAWLK